MNKESQKTSMSPKKRQQRPHFSNAEKEIILNTVKDLYNVNIKTQGVHYIEFCII